MDSADPEAAEPFPHDSTYRGKAQPPHDRGRRPRWTAMSSGMGEAAWRPPLRDGLRSGHPTGIDTGCPAFRNADRRMRIVLCAKRIIIHRRSRWFFICGQSPRILAAPSQAHGRSGICVGLLLTARQNGPFHYLPPLKGSSSLPNIVICSPNLSSSSWCLIYSAIFCLFLPTVST